MIQSIGQTIKWSNQTKNIKWARALQALSHVPATLTGGGNRVYTQGSGIGTDCSMLAANHRCNNGTASTFHQSYQSHQYSTLSNNSNINNNINNNKQYQSSNNINVSSSSSSLLQNQNQNKNHHGQKSFSTDKSGMDDEYGEMTADGHTYVHPTDFKLESGEELPNAQIRYMTYGKLNEARDNVLVVCHALTGNASLHSWWGDMLGPGLAFDTDKYFVVCSNILGSCYGSTGPASYKPSTAAANGTTTGTTTASSEEEKELYGIDFPDISVQDTVRLQLHMLRDDLKVRSVKCVIGGSFGGMQAVEYAVQGGTIRSPFAVDDVDGNAQVFVRSVMPIACGAKHTAWQIAISEVQRQAIYADPKWNNGKPSMDDPPLTGLSVARQIGMVSYRTPQGYESKFSRNLQDGSAPYGAKAAWQVKSYLEYQGFKFLSRFDPITYVKLTEQMDTHDIGRNRQGAKRALSNIQIPAMVLGIDSDVLYPLLEQEELADLFPNGELNVIKSDAGHDGFLLEQDQVAAHITDFLATHD
jgi:homoserine O-acetyltransferase